MEVVVTTGAIRRAKLQSKCHHQQTNTQFFTGRMPFQQCQSTEMGKVPCIYLHQRNTTVPTFKISLLSYLCGTAAGDVNAHVESVTLLTLLYCCKVRNKTRDFRKIVSECSYSLKAKWTQLQTFAASFVRILHAKSYLRVIQK